MYVIVFYRNDDRFSIKWTVHTDLVLFYVSLQAYMYWLSSAKVASVQSSVSKSKYRSYSLCSFFYRMLPPYLPPEIMAK